ncbi:MAG TPA: GAF domain-containing protein [Thermomicrobiales bacterium]|nr:GAF domain-containing protein [Thermomicrobiales bacterium]
MSKPLTTNLPGPPELEIQPFEFAFGPTDLGDALPAFDQDLAETQEEFIAQTLNWCAELFGASRARFIRPLDSGTWIVYTRQNDSVLTHMADQAEIAMAYTVGLSRQPLVVTRPRISKIDGSGLRPIALKSYLGIPIVCQDRLIGVVEFAGDVRPDMESALYSAAPRLANVGQRLLFDPGLRRKRGAITPDTSVALSSGVWARGNIVITPEEMTFLAAITGPMPLATIATAANLDTGRTLTVADELIERGLIEPRAN